MELTGIILSIAGFMIVFLLGIIGWFLRKFDMTITVLQQTVSNLVVFMEVEKAMTKSDKFNCIKRHEDLSNDIGELKRQISELKK